MLNSAQTAVRDVASETDSEVRVSVNESECIGCGICNLVCPDVFRIEGKKAIVAAKYVPEGLEQDCRIAARDCPLDAIIIE